MKQIKENENEENSGEEDDEENDWAGWEVASESSDSSSSDGWIEVSSDSDNDLELSDSDDEETKKDVVKGANDQEDTAPQLEGKEVAQLDPAQSIATTKVHFICILFFISLSKSLLSLNSSDSHSR